MKLCSRVVVIKGEYKNQTGTLMEIFTEGAPLGIKLDGDRAKFIKLDKESVLEIDDITNSGDIRFEKGMKVYDVQFEKEGEIIEVNQFDEDLEVHIIGWVDGSTSEFTLNEEFNFIIKD